MAIDFLTNAQRFSTGPLSSVAAPVLTCHASANTKGSYVDLIASTAFQAHWLLVFVGEASASGDFLIDIAIGAAASEQVILANISTMSQAKNNEPRYFLVPLPVPAGTRISARAQATTGGLTIACNVTIIGGAHIPALGVAVTYGVNTATSGGLTIDAGAVAGTKGAYGEITAATTRDIEWMVIMLSGNNTARSTYLFGLDIAIGAAASEQVIVADLQLGTHSSSDDLHPGFIALPCHIPAGSRIAARVNCNGTDASDRLVAVAILGVG